MITGDFNSRVCSVRDYVIDDVIHDYDITLDNNNVDNPLPWKTQDVTVNENGRLLIDFCRLTGMRIVNGRIFDDKLVCKFTLVKERGSSVVDSWLCLVWTIFFKTIFSF